MKSLNLLKTQIRLSIDEMDFGESTMALLDKIEEEGGKQIVDKLRESFQVKFIVYFN